MPKFKQSQLREPAPPGELRAVCVDVIDRPNTKRVFQGEERIRDVVTFVFQTEDRDSRGRRFLVFKDYTNSTHEKSTLRQHWESWYGREFDDEELAQIDMDEAVGKNCRLFIVHRKSKTSGRTYPSVQAILPPLMTQKLVPEDYVRRVDPEKGDEEGETPF